jgi:hypothetical protein
MQSSRQCEHWKRIFRVEAEVCGGGGVEWVCVRPACSGNRGASRDFTKHPVLQMCSFQFGHLPRLLGS